LPIFGDFFPFLAEKIDVFLKKQSHNSLIQIQILVKQSGHEQKPAIFSPNFSAKIFYKSKHLSLIR
jgi:hypothetical protein